MCLDQGCLLALPRQQLCMALMVINGAGMQDKGQTATGESFKAVKSRGQENPVACAVACS